MLSKIFRLILPSSAYLWFQHEINTARYGKPPLGSYSTSTNKLVEKVAKPGGPVGMTEDDIRHSLLLVTPELQRPTPRTEAPPIYDVRTYPRQRNRVK